MENCTVETIKKSKNSSKITMVTAYDALFGRLFDGVVDIILVGDSLSMSFGGQDDTLGITLDEMIYHTKAVCRGVQKSLVVLDMPFGSYIDANSALASGVRVLKETKASAVKLEGGQERAESIYTLTQNGIAVMGHIGLLPQSVRSEGGYKVKGKDDAQIEKLKKDIKAVEEAGAFCAVVEGVKAQVARELAAMTTLPLIGIGAGSGVDGQVLVFSDMLGLNGGHYPKFVRKYLDGAGLVQDAIKQYVEDVKNGRFPSDGESY